MKYVIIILIALILAAALFTMNRRTAATTPAGFTQISQEEAKTLMDGSEPHIILDVRTQEEYEGGHIPGAVLLPLDTVRENAEAVLPDKDMILLVYCRSGNRSKQASAILAQLGYTDIREFGGINTWPYDIEK